MATVQVAGMRYAKCQITTVDLREAAVSRNSKPRHAAAANEISVAMYHDDLKGLIGEPSYASVLSSKETSKNPFFHIGCAYVPSVDELYVTSDLLASTSSSKLPIVLISKVALSRDGQDRIWKAEWLKLRPPQNMTMPSGVVQHKHGLLFCSQGSTSTGTGGLFYMELGKPPQPVLTNYFGHDFNSIQEVVIAKDGTIWFCDSQVGFDKGIRPRPQLPSQIYRFHPETGDLRAVMTGLGRPRGLAFSPDESTLYVTVTDAASADGSADATRASTIFAFDVLIRSGSPFLTNQRVFAYPAHGVPMGIACDEKGNVYVGCGNGLQIWSPGGVILGVLEVPGGVKAFSFGKPSEIFLCSGQTLWTVSLAPVEEQLLLPVT